MGGVRLLRRFASGAEARGSYAYGSSPVYIDHPPHGIRSRTGVRPRKALWYLQERFVARRDTSTRRGGMSWRGDRHLSDARLCHGMPWRHAVAWHAYAQMCRGMQRRITRRLVAYDDEALIIIYFAVKHTPDTLVNLSHTFTELPRHVVASSLDMSR